jgi:PST family polysaccharide transporter
MSVARQTAWALVGVGGQQLIRLVVVIILARLLTPADFGVVAAAQIIFAIAETFVDFGIGVGLLQIKALDVRTERSAMTIVLASTTGIAAVVALAAGPLADFLGIAEVEAVLPWIALVFLFQGATGPPVQLMFREGRFRQVSTAQLVSGVIGQAAVSIVLALMGWGYWSLVAGMVAYAVLQLAVTFWMRPVWPTLRPDWAKLRPIVHFGAGVLAAMLLGKIARRADNWVAGRFLGAAALGFYSRAYSLMDLANQLPGVVMTRVMIPHFARHSHSGDRREMAVRQFYLTHVAAAALTLPMSLASVLLAPEIIAILLGPGWEPAGPVLGILGAGIYFRLAYKVSGVVVLGYGRSWRSAFQATIYAILVVGGSLFAYRYGLEGIAWAVLIALAWQFWAQTAVALDSTGGSWRALGAALWPVILATLVAAVAGIGTFALLEHSSNPWLRLMAIGLAMTLPYSGILWLLRGTAPIEGLIRLVKSVLAPAKPSSALK